MGSGLDKVSSGLDKVSSQLDKVSNRLDKVSVLPDKVSSQFDKVSSRLEKMSRTKMTLNEWRLGGSFNQICFIKWGGICYLSIGNVHLSIGSKTFISILKLHS